MRQKVAIVHMMFNSKPCYTAFVEINNEMPEMPV
jgi:hypothetical protein